MFNSILTDTLTPLTFGICLGSAFILGLVVAILHAKTARPNRNFVMTLAILPMLVAMAILLVNGNLGTSVATLGVFSLVRFRSIPGNSRAILDVFFAMAIGLAVGTGYIVFAALFTVVVSLIIATLHVLRFGEHGRTEQRLIVLVPEDIDYTTIFDDTFNKYATRATLERSKTTNMGSLFELTYSVDLKPHTNEKEFIDQLRVKNGNLKIALSHALADEEL